VGEEMRQYLKDMREERSMTTIKAAELANLTQSHYCMIESGERQADMALSIMKKLANGFNVSLQTIIDEETKYVSGEAT
jgi:transcriptional regulator with XRE-family HTH domain